jgi:hypothetical protein
MYGLLYRIACSLKLDKYFTMRAYEFLVEDLADDLIKELSSIGYTKFKKESGKTVTLYVPDNQRRPTIQKILTSIPDTVHDPSAGRSSLGAIKYKGGTIKIKPEGKSGDDSAGLRNEIHLIATINSKIQELGPIDITFLGDNGKNVEAKNVTEAIGTGKSTTDRKKSDVSLISNGKLIPISIKKKTSEYWESADTLFGKRADVIVDKLEKEGKISLTQVGTVRPSDNTPKVRISPEVAIKATPEETADVVFGSDILKGNGAVVKEDFRDETYKISGNKMTVTCDLVITEPNDIPESMQVYFHIRNDRTRNRPGSKYPGLRVLASYASRIKNALIIDQTDI